MRKEGEKLTPEGDALADTYKEKAVGNQTVKCWRCGGTGTIDSKKCFDCGGTGKTIKDWDPLRI